ncbi:NHL repeat protein [Leptospira broomii serovar Hurstbridge str. 5399]|uniref:NHL repeat protein n=1 Tax=Leptospira broomii serovar Hurstbridge str. 5399 TaxID=1049789 RepID=T0GLW0_9LEPT|nr:NHL repeat protein [Leptospira broomii serovar Hurstbridge str. 5399]
MLLCEKKKGSSGFRIELYFQRRLVVLLLLVFAFLFYGCNKALPLSIDMSHGAGFLLSLILENRPASSCVPPTALTLGESATVVLGQSDYVSTSFGSASNRMHNPQGIAIDSNGGIWVADSANNRVLHFPSSIASGGNPDIILGGTSGTGLNQFTSPGGIALDLSGGLWVTDGSNQRVLHFPSGVTTGGSANIVIGVTGSPGTTNSLLNNPSGVAVDASGGLWVVDYANFRALHFSAPLTSGMAADRVLGQPNFTISSVGSPPNAVNLGGPSSIKVDSSGGVWISDTGNSRILHYSAPITNAMSADLVIGSTNFTSTLNGVTSANALWAPSGVSLDSKGGMWVSDSQFRRVTHYSLPFSNGMNADNVLGEPDYVSFNSSLTVSASKVGNPFDLTVTPCGQLWVTDYTFNRVLFYP